MVERLFIEPTEPMADEEPLIDENGYLGPTAVYALLVRMVLAAGWRRAKGAGSVWTHPDRPGGYAIGTVVELEMASHGVDLREPVPGEEATE